MREVTLVMRRVVEFSILLGVMMGWGEYSPSPQKSYYDAREKVAEELTFEWSQTIQTRYSEGFVDDVNQTISHFANLLETSPDKVKIYDPSTIANNILEDTHSFTIERTPRWTRVRRIYPVSEIDGTNVTLHQEEIWVGMGLVVQVFLDDHSVPTSIDLAESRKDVLGMGCPSGGFTPEFLILYGGVSPFRLYGGGPENWKLVSSSPEEWVFEWAGTDKKEPETIKVHLSRRHQDALSKIEIRYADGGYRVWRVRKYKFIKGTWFPSEIEEEEKTQKWEGKSRATLVGYRRSQPIALFIPDGIPVRDWRRWGDQAWQGSIADGGEEGVGGVIFGGGFETLEWSASLGQSLGLPLASSSQK